MISLNKLFASVRLIDMWPLPDPVSLEKTTALLGTGFSELRKWRGQYLETATGLWSFSVCLLIVLETSSVVLWCMSVLQFQTSWLNPLTVSDWTVLMPLEIFFLFCCLISLVTALVSSDFLYPQTVKWWYVHFHALFFIYNSFIHWNRSCLTLCDLFLNL